MLITIRISLAWRTLMQWMARDIGVYSGFPGIAARVGFTEIIYDGRPRPGTGDKRAEARAEWDRLNRLALEKLQFYVSVRVHQSSEDGEELTVRQYYQRFNRLFLRIGGKVYQHCIFKRLAPKAVSFEIHRLDLDLILCLIIQLNTGVQFEWTL